MGSQVSCWSGLVEVSITKRNTMDIFRGAKQIQLLKFLRRQTYLFQIAFPWLLLVVTVAIIEVTPYKEFPPKK